MSSELQQPLLSVDFGDEIGKKQWQTYDELISWIDNLRNEWTWVNVGNQYNFQSVWQKIADILAEPASLVNQAKQYRLNNQTDAERNHLSTVKSKLEDVVRRFPWLLDSAQRDYVKSIQATGQVECASATVAHWLGMELNILPLKFAIPAILKWELYERGIKDRFQSENTKLKKLAGDIQTSLFEVSESRKQQTYHFDSLCESLSEQIADHQLAFNLSQSERENGWEKLLQKTDSDLENLKNTYDKYMALAAPVDYWDTKRRKHEKWTRWTFVALIICMFLSGILLHKELSSIGNAFEKNQNQNQLRNSTTLSQNKVDESNILVKGTEAIKPKVSASLPEKNETKTEALSLSSVLQTGVSLHLGSFILLATLVFWVLRLLVRVLLSNMHLENDAAERVVMAKTYLSLIREGNLPKGESINTVLAALFRPSGDGIVKDEGVPPTTLDWFTKLGK